MAHLIKKVKDRLSAAFRKKTNIPSYEEKRAVINHYKELFHLETLIETGTFLGDTIEYFKDRFNSLYSIELSEELAEKAKKRFAGDQNVTIIQGDSGEVLKQIVNDITRPSLFWLDGHYSSEFFHNGEFIKTAKGKKDTPVEQELEVLLNCECSHVILIDDARLFVGQNGYPTIKEIRNRAARARHKFAVSVHKDIINIVPV